MWKIQENRGINIILLNTKSILDCNEEETEIHFKETEIHFKEIETLFEKLSTNNHLCIVKVSYLDPYQKKTKEIKVHQMPMSKIEDFIQNFDIKNGADIYNDQKNIVIKLYGQTYQYKDKNYMNTTQLYTRKEI